MDDKTVLKIARDAYHVLFNQREIETWQAVKDTDGAHRFFRPLAWADDYSWVTYERAPRIASGWEPPGHEGIVYNLYHDPRWRAFETTMNELYGVSDTSAINVGVREDGSFAVLDYGNRYDSIEDMTRRLQERELIAA
jgi:hypothetical protein